MSWGLIKCVAADAKIWHRKKTGNWQVCEILLN